MICDYDYKTLRNLREPSFEALLDTALPPDSLGRVIVGALDNITWPGCLAEIGYTNTPHTRCNHLQGSKELLAFIEGLFLLIHCAVLLSTGWLLVYKAK